MTTSPSSKSASSRSAWASSDATERATAAASPALAAPVSARPKSRAGRRPGAVWGYFTALRTEHNKTHAVCRFCARRCAGVAARMTAHLLTKCPAVPATERDVMAAAFTQDAAAPAVKRQRVDNNTAGLAAFASARPPATKDIMNDDKALAAALQFVYVACLRVHAPLTLVDDVFFRDALAVLRPHALPGIKTTDAATLRESVHVSVAHDAALWMGKSESFTLVHNAVAREWRGADSERHGVLIADATDSVRDDLEAHLQSLSVDTVVGVCSTTSRSVDQPRATEGEVSSTAEASPFARIKLRSQCLLTQTARMWTLVAGAVPELASVVVGAAEIAQTYASLALPLMATTESTPTTDEWALDTHDLLTAGWSLPFRIVKRVDAMGQSLKLLEMDAIKVAARTAFWKDLTDVDALLAPFAWAYVLSESKSVCSSQLVLCWLWLLATIEQSPLLTDESKRNELINALLTVITQTVEDHHLVAFLLDPRTRGAGLSTIGRRKVKTLVPLVAARLWPSRFEPATTAAGPTDGSSHARQALLAQLGHYIDKTGCFSDEVMWEMAQGTAPENFWRDYAQEAPELTSLAMAVLTFVPVTSSASEFVDAKHVDVQSPREPFETRQIRFHFERNRKNGEFEMTTVLTKYAELVGPSNARTQPSSSSVPQTLPLSQSPVALTLVDAVVAELQRLASADPSIEPGTLADASYANVSDLDATWFAYQTGAGATEIAAARRRMLPSVLLTTAASAHATPTSV